MSTSIIKFIDSAILPASVMILSKLTGLWFAVKMFSLNWEVSLWGSNSIGIHPIFLGQDINLASSFSDGCMLIAMLVGFGFHTIRAVFFHDTHIDPKLVVRLVGANLFTLVSNSFHIYHTLSMWFIFSLIAVILTIWNIFLSQTFLWIGVIAVIIFLFLIVLVIRDIELEVQEKKRNLKM